MGRQGVGCRCSGGHAGLNVRDGTRECGRSEEAVFKAAADMAWCPDRGAQSEVLLRVGGSLLSVARRLLGSHGGGALVHFQKHRSLRAVVGGRKPEGEVWVT